MNDKENGLDNVEAVECTRPQMGHSRQFQITQAGPIPTFYFDMRQQTLHDQPPRHSAEEVGLHIEHGEMTL